MICVSIGYIRNNMLAGSRSILCVVLYYMSLLIRMHVLQFENFVSDTIMNHASDTLLRAQL